MMQPLEVTCSSCRGRSAIEPEHRSKPKWTCPFCSIVNGMPAPLAPQPARAPARRPLSAHVPAPGPSPEPETQPTPKRRSFAGPLAAAACAAAAGLLILSIASSTPEPRYRTVEGIVEALRRRGIACTGLTISPPPKGVRERGTCAIGIQTVAIFTFTSEAERDAYGDPRAGTQGAIWIVFAEPESLRRRISDALTE